MKQTKVLIHSIVFSPDGVSTAYLYNDIALGLIKNGYEVVVLTTTPHYNVIKDELIKQPLNKHFFGLYYISDFKGIKVYHVPLKKYKSTLFRILSFVYWHVFSFFLGLSFKKINFILSPSPPLSVGFVSLLLAKIIGAKSIYNVQEIYPDLLVNQGSLKSKLVINILQRFEKFIYNYSAAVITIDEVFYNQIKDRFYDISKLKIISNFVDTDLYKPINSNQNLPEVFPKTDLKIILLYAGNIGFFQDWDPIIYAANQLKDNNIEFWIIGEGVKKEYLQNIVEEQKLINIKILPYQQREYMPIINSFADIHFISINQEMEQEGFPSKIYTIMACSKPMIVITGKNTPLFNFLSNKDCSILISEERNENFVKAIIDLALDKNKRDFLGHNGYLEIQTNYSKEKVINKYIELLEELS